MTTAIKGDEVEVLHKKLVDCLNGVQLGVAGRVLYYDKDLNCFILAVHTTSPDKTQEVASLVWENVPKDLRVELREANIGFAGKQI